MTDLQEIGGFAWVQVESDLRKMGSVIETVTPRAFLFCEVKLKGCAISHYAPQQRYALYAHDFLRQTCLRAKA